MSNRVDSEWTPVFRHSSSTAVSDPLTPAKHMLTHHVTVIVVLRMIHHPRYLLCGGPIINRQGNKVYRENRVQSVTVLYRCTL